MKIIFELRHPAHFHHFKHTISRLRNQGHTVLIVISKKDILIELLKAEKYDFTIIGINRSNKFFKILEILKQDIRFFKICKSFKPDLLVGRPSHPLTFISWLLKIDSIIFAEDDFNAIFFNGIISYPFAKFILTPRATDLGMFNRKKVGYDGYQKLAYLHPKIFTPDINLISNYVDINKPFFLIRLAKLTAGHDINKSGISKEILDKLIFRLEKLGKVFITSERHIDESYNKYLLKLPVQFIHHFLFYTTLFIGDSQSMAFEAAMLGTPSIRFSDFAGKISVLEELEHKYNLTFGIKTLEPQKMFSKIEELLSLQNLRNEFQQRRQKMLDDKIDVTSFMVWFIENYPDSLTIAKNNSNKFSNFNNGLYSKKI